MILTPVSAQGMLPVLDPFGGMQEIGFTTGNTVSANGVGDGTHVVWVVATKLCYVDVGPTPVASATTFVLFPGVYWPLPCRPGDKVAFKGVTEGGSGWMMEVRNYG